MELRLQSASYNVPEDWYVAVRVGDVQKQNRFARSKVYRFPGASKYGHIDVFKRIGTRSMEFDGEKESHFNLSIPCSDPRLEELQFNAGCSVVEKGREGSSGRLDRVKHKTDAAREYMSKHGLEELLADAMRHVIREKPADPHQFLSNFILSRNSSGKSSFLPQINDTPHVQVRDAPMWKPQPVVYQSGLPDNSLVAPQSPCSNQNRKPDCRTKLPPLEIPTLTATQVDQHVPVKAQETLIPAKPGADINAVQQKMVGGTAEANAVQTNVQFSLQIGDDDRTRLSALLKQHAKILSSESLRNKMEETLLDAARSGKLVEILSEWNPQVKGKLPAISCTGELAYDLKEQMEPVVQPVEPVGEVKNQQGLQNKLLQGALIETRTATEEQALEAAKEVISEKVRTRAKMSFTDALYSGVLQRALCKREAADKVAHCIQANEQTRLQISDDDRRLSALLEQHALNLSGGKVHANGDHAAALSQMQVIDKVQIQARAAITHDDGRLSALLKQHALNLSGAKANANGDHAAAFSQVQVIDKAQIQARAAITDDDKRLSALLKQHVPVCAQEALMPQQPGAVVNAVQANVQTILQMSDDEKGRLSALLRQHAPGLSDAKANANGDHAAAFSQVQVIDKARVAFVQAARNGDLLTALTLRNKTLSICRAYCDGNGDLGHVLNVQSKAQHALGGAAANGCLGHALNAASAYVADELRDQEKGSVTADMQKSASKEESRPSSVEVIMNMQAQIEDKDTQVLELHRQIKLLEEQFEHQPVAIKGS